MNTKIGRPSFKKNGNVEKLIYLELWGSSYGISDLKWRKMITFLKGPCSEGHLGPPWKIITFLKALCSSHNVFWIEGVPLSLSVDWTCCKSAKWICRNTEVLLQTSINSSAFAIDVSGCAHSCNVVPMRSASTWSWSSLRGEGDCSGTCP